MDWVHQWVEQSPYGKALGARLTSVESESVRLALPYSDENSNGDKALHGGVAASMIVLGGQALARATLGQESGPWHTAMLQVGYLSAALGETILAEARLLRRGKELAYVDVEVRSESGKPIAHGLMTVRGVFGAQPGPLPRTSGDDGKADPGPMGPFIGGIPYHEKLGISVEHMVGGRSRISMPWSESNADGSGGVHEGPVLALLDTTGAMAAWAETGPGRFKASTPGIQARILAPITRDDLVGYGKVLHRDRELLFCTVEVAGRSDGRMIAHGNVNYRIVTPEHTR